MVYGNTALNLASYAASDMGSSDIDFGVVELFGSPEEWDSKEQQEGYYSRAIEVLEQYHICKQELAIVNSDIEQFHIPTWEEVFNPDDGLKGVSYDGVRVQTSNISNIPERLMIQAEDRIEREKYRLERMKREAALLSRRMAFSKRVLNTLRGNTRTVAELFWYNDKCYRWEDVAHKIDRSQTTVKRERDKAVDEVAKYLKRKDCRDCSEWFR